MELAQEGAELRRRRWRGAVAVVVCFRVFAQHPEALQPRVSFFLRAEHHVHLHDFAFLVVVCTIVLVTTATATVAAAAISKGEAYLSQLGFGFVVLTIWRQLCRDCGSNVDYMVKRNAIQLSFGGL